MIGKCHKCGDIETRPPYKDARAIVIVCYKCRTIREKPPVKEPIVVFKSILIKKKLRT